MLDRDQAHSRGGSSPQAQVALLLTVAALLGVYVILRYAGRAGEGDTLAATAAIRDMAATGRLDPGAGYNVYPNGYSFQALGVFLTGVTGMSLPALQTFGAVLLAAWLVWPAWLLYRTFTGAAAGATLATVILFVQPEFLFPILRGTHEKFTRGFMLLCLFLLLRGLQARHRQVSLSGLVLAFYLAVYALISFNNLLAMSFLLAMLLALALTALVRLRSRDSTRALLPVTRKLTYVVITSVIIAFVFTFYAYKPALHDLMLLQSAIDRIATLFLDVEAQPANPYTYWVIGAWVSTPIYLVLTLANWLLLGSSMVIWLWQSARWLLRGQRPQDDSQLLLWSFYGAFALLQGLSILADVSGVLGSTMQHRGFPSFAMVAAPLVARWLTEWQPRRTPAGRLAVSGLWATLLILAVLSILKATNEPLASNKWIFYRPAEMTALDWAEKALPGRFVWSEYDERLFTGYGIRAAGQSAQALGDINVPEPGTRDYLITEVTRARGLRLALPLPTEPDDLVTYDNGEAQMYHRLPATPYQR